MQTCDKVVGDHERGALSWGRRGVFYSSHNTGSTGDPTRPTSQGGHSARAGHQQLGNTMAWGEGGRAEGQTPASHTQKHEEKEQPAKPPRGHHAALVTLGQWADHKAEVAPLSSQHGRAAEMSTAQTDMEHDPIHATGKEEQKKTVAKLL